MVSKRETLRRGDPYEVSPGVFGRLNFEDQTLELSNGKKLPISEKDKQDLFTKDEKQLGVIREKEKIEREVKQAPLGEFFHQFSEKGLVGGAKDWASRLINTGDDYLKKKQARQAVSERISEESPWTSGAATAASFIPDFALTRGLSAAKAAPILYTASQGSRVLDEPREVLEGAALSAGGGYLLDKGVNFLNKTAARRGASRQVAQDTERVAQQNATRQQATTQANAEQRESFNALRERVKNENDALLHQHNLTLNERQNRVIEAKNAFEKARADRESEIFRLENEYKTARAERNANAQSLESEYKTAKAAAEEETKRLNQEYQLAQKQYQESLKQLPELQKKAQSEYSENVLKNTKDIQKAFPKDSKIPVNQLGVQNFLDDTLMREGLSGTREGAQASRILRSIFPEGESITSKELSSRYRALEESIKRATPEVQSILSDFKTHMGTRLPAVLEDTIAYSKIVPSLQRQIERDIGSLIKDQAVLSRAKANVETLFKEISPENFVQGVESGDFSKLLQSRILTPEDFLKDFSKDAIEKLRKQGMLQYAQQSVNAQHAEFVNKIAQKIDNTLARAEIKAMQAGKEASKKLGRDIKRTYGTAAPVPNPVAPTAPSPIQPPSPPTLPIDVAPPARPPNIPPPETPPLPAPPSLTSMPSAPATQTFIPETAPILPPAQGIAERLGDALEKPIFRGGKGMINNPLLKLAGLKYALGKAALPVEATAAAGYGALKGLTAPGAEVARQGFKQIGIQAIDEMARKYPSYHNGIVDSPQERRSLTKEVEDDPEIPAEQKAMIQSKINRGKPIFDRLI